jgi:cyclophilin family peptidyl-prolyl cis-trans isomerase
MCVYVYMCVYVCICVYTHTVHSRIFMHSQFGITEKPEHKHWHGKQIQDDPHLQHGIRKHYVSFAGGGPNTRSTQIFIAYKDLDFLGKAPWEVSECVVMNVCMCVCVCVCVYVCIAIRILSSR